MVTRSVSKGSSLVVNLNASTGERRVSKTITASFWKEWTDWYHTFVAELKDEGLSKTSEAEERWTKFCVNKLKKDESSVRAWLSSTKKTRV